MSDPMQVQSVEDDSGAMDAPELPLSSDLDDGGDADPEPVAAPSGDAGGDPAPTTATWFDRQGVARQTRIGGYKERQRQRNDEIRRNRELLDQYQNRDTETKRLLMEALELARGKQAPEEEEIPDPILQPAEYRQWLRTQTRTDLEETLKPFTGYIQAQQERQEAEREQQLYVEEARAFVQQEMATFEAARAAYERDEPELAAGAELRFKQGQALLEGCFRNMGKANPSQAASKLLFEIAQGAREEGDNEVAAIDAFLSSLYYEVSLQMVAAGLLDQPLVPMGAAAPTPAAQPAPQRTTPAATEARRIEAVRQRTRAAGSVTPREPAGGHVAAKSEAQEVLNESVRRTGHVDWGLVKAAALRDTRGDMMAAAALTSRLRQR